MSSFRSVARRGNRIEERVNRGMGPKGAFGIAGESTVGALEGVCSESCLERKKKKRKRERNKKRLVWGPDLRRKIRTLCMCTGTRGAMGVHGEEKTRRKGDGEGGLGGKDYVWAGVGQGITQKEDAAKRGGKGQEGGRKRTAETKRGGVKWC